MDVSANARVTLRHQGTDYRFDFPHASTGSAASEVESGMHYQWTDGNYGCDCNLIPFIEQYCGVDLIAENQEVECGDTVELVALEAVYSDGTVTQLYPDPVRTDERLSAIGMVSY